MLDEATAVAAVGPRFDGRVRAPAPERDDFLGGICVALQVVTAMDCGVTWAEIVHTVGVDQLLQYATFVEPAEWELAGFAKYAQVELRRRRPRKRSNRL